MLPQNSVFIVYEVSDVCTKENKTDDLIVVFRDDQKPEVLRKTDKASAPRVVSDNKTWRFFHTPPDNNPFRRKQKNWDPSQGAEDEPIQYRCGYNQCGKRFETKFGLYQHLSRCDKRYKLPPTVAKFSGNKKKSFKYTCPICDYRFKNFHNYNTHLTIHSQPGQHKCLQCNAAFRSNRSLYGHMLRHRKIDAREKNSKQ